MDTMDQFDFSAPINATIIFDDSDDETFEKKTSIENMRREKDETTIDSPKVEQEQKVNEKQTEDNLLKPISNTSETETCASVEQNIESTTRKLLKYRKPVISKNIKKRVLQQKPLDMPSLEEENNNVVNDASNIEKQDKSEETNKINNTNTETQNEIELPIETKKVLKRKLTEELGISDKMRKTRKKSAENTCERIENIDLINENKKNVTFKEDCSTNDSDGAQKRDSSGVAIHSKYFVSSNQSLSNKEESLTQSLKQYIEKTNLINIEVEINPTTKPNQELIVINQEEPNGNKSSQLLNESNKTIANCLKKLFDTVSEHMIYVLNSYQTYAKLVQTNADPRLIENAKNSYINTRGHFFDLSYSSVLNIIIPRNNEPTFVKEFLNSTIEMAHSKSYNYSYGQIELLYADMLTWVQKRQIQVQNMNTNPILIQQLQKPYSRPPIPQQNYQVRLDSPRSRKTPSQPRLSHKQRQPIPTVQNLQHSIPQSKPPSYPNQNQQYLERRALDGYYFQSDRIAEQNIRPTYLSQQNARKHEDQLLYTHSDQNTFLKSINDSLHQTLNQRTDIQLYPNYNHQVQGTLQQNSATSPPWLNSGKPMRQKQASQTWQNDSLPSYSQNFRNCPVIISSQNNQHVQVIQPEITIQVEPNRSSISRDSGFMSPLNFNTNNDLPEEPQAQSSTPLITHVTSLNPNVSLIEDGNCAVCGKVTKQKCLGCFSCYYCSHGCQFLDWKIHQLVCK